MGEGGFSEGGYLDHVVDQGHAEVPVQLDRLVLEHVFEASLGTVLGQDQHRGTLDARAQEPHGVLVGDVPHLEMTMCQELSHKTGELGFEVKHTAELEEET